MGVYQQKLKITPIYIAKIFFKENRFLNATLFDGSDDAERLSGMKQTN